jgi:integrase
VKVYAGTDPLTGREIRLRKTCKTERAAQIELGKLHEQAAAGRQPETNASVVELMDRYAEVADWDLSTRKANGSGRGADHRPPRPDRDRSR